MSPADGDGKEAADELVGVWRLVSFHDLDDAGAHVQGPLGPHPDGLLIYTACGHVSVSMMGAGTAGQPNFMGYAGSWRCTAQGVVHRIEVTPRPDWRGTEQVRTVEWDGDRLTLHAATEVAGRERCRVLVWRRVEFGQGASRPG